MEATQARGLHFFILMLLLIVLPCYVSRVGCGLQLDDNWCTLITRPRYAIADAGPVVIIQLKLLLLEKGLAYSRLHSQK